MTAGKRPSEEDHSDHDGSGSGTGSDSDTIPNFNANSTANTILSVKPIRSRIMKKTPVSSAKKTKMMWTEQDGVVILKSMIKYLKKHGREPSTSAEFDELRDLVRKHIQSEFTRMQLTDKVRKLKQKFFSLCSKDKEFSEYEKTVVELSKHIWATRNDHEEDTAAAAGDVGGNGGGVQLSGKEEANGSDGIDTGEDVRRSSGKSKKQRKTITDSDKDMQIATDAAPSPFVLEGDAILHPKLTEMVRQIENDTLNSPMHGSFEKAFKMMTPASSKAWEEKWKKQCLAEMDLYKKRVVLKSQLVEELQGIFNSANS